ncbi:hypothetical protein [Novosphingobium sp. KN65.2]|uniref:hypothetical protein n=1 Tax=Novosphingobium sp. KN65.2 TaxID=1478134 RepID=UPI0012E23BC3|nr:hypothetical protein [Novosphingobium sp. KN65.2]
MAAIVPVLVGALVTAIAGNFLVQRWQMRNWREQQRQLGYKAELDDLRKLIEEISTKYADRHNAMRNVISSLAPNSHLVLEEALDAYRGQVVIWNGALNSFYVRLRISIDYASAIRLEHDVHEPFALAGRKIEAVVRAKRQGEEISWRDLSEAKELLNKLQGTSYGFLRDLTTDYSDRRSEIFEGRKIFYRDGVLTEYSTFDLIKAIFALPIDKFYIIRTS